jgi:hypothetical protein
LLAPQAEERAEEEAEECVSYLLQAFSFGFSAATKSLPAILLVHFFQVENQIQLLVNSEDSFESAHH